MAGGEGVRWGVGRPSDLKDVDGIIIGGGDDIGPDLYDGHMVTSARIDPARDRLELRVVEEALDRDLPVLGICRGAQMLNVALGGTLRADAFAHHTGSDAFKTVLPRKTVFVREGTRLAGLAGAEPMRVNALHSQAVDQLGEGLLIAAEDRGGMVQAVERVEDPFALGVQWHPEHLFYARRQRRIFAGLVAAARAAREGRAQVEAVDREVS